MIFFEINQNINFIGTIDRIVNLPEQEKGKLIRPGVVSITNPKQYLKSLKSILDQTNIMMNETNKEMQSNIDIRYQISAQQSYVKDNPIIIGFRLENHLNENLWVLRWYTPLEGLKGKIFRVICDGKEIPYEGPMVRRGQPKKDDYVHIPPGSSVSVEVNLSDTYTCPACKECRVEFKGQIYDFSKSADYLPKKSEEHQMINTIGNTVTFNVAHN